MYNETGYLYFKNADGSEKINVKSFNSFDIDGVIYLDGGITGIFPGPEDVIITGRSFEELPETDKMLKARGIHNQVFYNNIPFNLKTREKSATHKASVLHKLTVEHGYTHGVHYEDDPLQIDMMRTLIPWVNIIHVNSAGMVELENTRHYE